MNAAATRPDSGAAETGPGPSPQRGAAGPARSGMDGEGGSEQCANTPSETSKALLTSGYADRKGFREWSLGESNP